MQNKLVKKFIRSLYYIQQIRVQSYNRIVSVVYVNEDKPEEELTEKEKKELSKLRESKVKEMIAFYDANHKEIDAKRIDRRESFIKSLNGPIQSILMYALVASYVKLREQEDELTKAITLEVKKVPIYKEFLSKIKGMGPLMSAVLISEIDIEKTRHVSSLWKLCGLDVVVNKDGVGSGRSKRQEHLVDVEYIGKDGAKHTKKSITYNAFLKSKLMGVVFTNFLMHGGEYKKIYNKKKTSYMNNPKHAAKSKLHIHNMAGRYMIKIFLKDLWNVWSELEGYEREPDYWEAYVSDRAPGESLLKHR